MGPKPGLINPPATFGAIGSHSTGTTKGSWDGPAVMKALPAKASALRACCAWVDSSGDPNSKSSYKFPHHASPGGPANLTACSAGIAALNGGRGGASIPSGDKGGVYAHLAKHLKDGGADVPPRKFTSEGVLTFDVVGPMVPMSNPIPFTAVLLQEGVWTSDGRFINIGATTFRQTPLTMMAMFVTAEGHEGAEAAGRIDTIERVPQSDGTANIVAKGAFDGGSAFGLEAARKVGEQIVRGVSVDLAFQGVEFGESDKGLPTMTLTECEVLGATVCPMQAFEGCSLALDDPTALTQPSEAMVAAGIPQLSETQPDVPWHTVTEDGCVPCAEAREAITAAGSIPTAPPAEWFADPQFTAATPLTITDDGQVYGHLAEWGTCHTAFQDSCVMAPRSTTNYAIFRTGCVQCEDGTVVATGTLTMDTGHADLYLDAAAAVAHYDNTGTGVADVVVGEDAFGPWMAGALRPGVTPEQIRTLRASPPSGDWRGRAGSLELIAVLAVPHPGFPVARVASGAPVALVAGSNLLPDLPDDTERELPLILDELRTWRLDREIDRLATRIRKP